MQGVITAPRNIITGAFNIRFDFIRAIQLTAADVVVETLEGDALGHPKDSFAGSGANYLMLCYLPDARKGRSRVSVNKPGVTVDAVVVAYDTGRTATATWGTPFRRKNGIEIPLSFDVAIAYLQKRNFNLPFPFQLYGADDHYSLVIPRCARGAVFTVSVSGEILKANGVSVEITEAALEVDCGTLN